MIPFDYKILERVNYMSNSEQLKIEIGNRIRELRIGKGMSQEELAKAVGYTSEHSRSTINKVEKGKNDITQSRLKKYAKALDTSVAYLLGLGVNDEKFNPNGELSEQSTAYYIIQNAFGSDAVELVSAFSQLNDQGKEKALDTISDLLQIPKYKKGE